MRCVKALQLTLAVIKPDAVAHPLILEALHQKILENFIIIRKKDLIWRKADSEMFYAEHTGRFFFQRLVEFMSSGPMRAYILAREDAITHWRMMMGPTKVFRARFSSPETLRGQYGLTDTRNTTHGSEFSADEWMIREEPRFRLGLTEYNEESQIHTVKHT
ncbi:nucleoside diphosphate kinase 6 isoform X3 [Danio aesculapii]|uniref:nucleoside diphosphate kinase 6 isoform X3 n=1 Tax=Danio aesculapii TaxID=1142201 RepID=UPI0024BFDE98|nr:nucleoside diphosphate kinase 6 isoform X3 [Danio aesculapii]